MSPRIETTSTGLLWRAGGVVRRASANGACITLPSTGMVEGLGAVPLERILSLSPRTASPTTRLGPTGKLAWTWPPVA